MHDVSGRSDMWDVIEGSGNPGHWPAEVQIHQIEGALPQQVQTNHLQVDLFFAFYQGAKCKKGRSLFGYLVTNTDIRKWDVTEFLILIKDNLRHFCWTCTWKWRRDRGTRLWRRNQRLSDTSWRCWTSSFRIISRSRTRITRSSILSVNYWNCVHKWWNWWKLLDWQYIYSEQS